MARSRNIKHGFFLNDELAEIEPIGRLFFIGLWTVADYQGRLEYRPKKLKAELVPYDDCDIESIVSNLNKSGFIAIYSVQGKRYLEIVNFTKHQNPHKNERDKGSSIPSPNSCSADNDEEGSQPIDNKGIAIKPDKIGTAPDNNESDRADSLFLIPDSCSLIPDSLIPDSLIPDSLEKTSTSTSEVKVNLDHPIFSSGKSRDKKMNEGWLPSKAAIDILKKQHGISSEFAEKCIPEFILYWKDRGESRPSWDSTFITNTVRSFRNDKNAARRELAANGASPQPMRKPMPIPGRTA